LIDQEFMCVGMGVRVGVFRVLRFPPPVKLATTICIEYC
jgi:hypothetical protein